MKAESVTSPVSLPSGAHGGGWMGLGLDGGETGDALPLFR